MRWIALLRGVNVGGRRRVPMAPLRAALADAGFTAVRTYVQSGNVVLDDRGDVAPADVARRIARVIDERFDVATAVEVRTREQLAAIVADNPFPEAVATPTALHVAFLSAPVEPAALADVDAAAYAPERFALRGRALYLHLPDGIGRSPLAQALSERRLGVRATVRNWRTVAALLALADAEP